jgi:hypothetical protein
MPDPLADRLSRLTPDATGLDRGALLFAAGRASVRAPRRWQALVAILAATQLATLGLWLLRPRSTVLGVPAAVAPAEPPRYAPAEPSPFAAINRQLLDPDAASPAPSMIDPSPPEPPLRAFAAAARLSVD